MRPPVEKEMSCTEFWNDAQRMRNIEEVDQETGEFREG